MLFPLIKEILSLPPDGREVTVRGWVRTKRELKNLVFIEVNDGSCFRGIQCTFDRDRYSRAGPANGEANGEAPDRGTPGRDAPDQEALDLAGTGASVTITGALVPSPAAGQAVELAAAAVRLIGQAPGEGQPGIPPYPLQKKRHSLEFLREIAHLRPRTNTFAAVARVRSRLAFGVHQFFQQHGYQYIHSPVITANDAEGAGAMFQVTTLDLEALAREGGNRKAQPGDGGPQQRQTAAPRTDTSIDYSQDFFGKKTGLTVSGQLEAETYAAALSRVYTFGPTFRAEHSNTTRHLAEFWMIEPETAFAELEDNMILAEEFLKFLVTTLLRDCGEDLAFFEAHYEPDLREHLETLSRSPFSHISYTDAVAELEHHPDNFEFKPYWGCDLQSEHEKYLTEHVCSGPVIVTDYPKDIKAFYMKLNDDHKTVRAMDVLVPRLGEIIGGSQREEDLEKLRRRMEELGMKLGDYQWYLDLRRYGTVPHSGFGLGFERFIQYVTGMTNIRDVIPYPRSAGQAEF
jgi:asparaginyl-tRNA synthetase